MQILLLGIIIGLLLAGTIFLGGIFISNRYKIIEKTKHIGTKKPNVTILEDETDKISKIEQLLNVSHEK